MNEIRIEDLNYFDEFLTSICKVTGACKFTVNDQGCSIDLKNDSETFKAFFKTTVLTSEEPVEFCLFDIRKLGQSIKLVIDYRKKKLESFISKNKTDGKTIKYLTDTFSLKETKYKLVYDRPFVRFNRDGIKFKFSTIKESLISHTIGRKNSIELIPEYSCTINSKTIKKICSLSSITSLAKPKIYMYKEKQGETDFIIGEIDDKKDSLSDSISYPLTETFTGKWLNPMCIKIELFNLFNIVESEEIVVTMTTMNSIIVNSSNKFTTVNIIAQGLRK